MRAVIAILVVYNSSLCEH